MGINNIEKWSLGYELLKRFVRFWHNRVYYRKVYVLNADKVPEDEQVIFAPNHQNALMDAMAVLHTQKGQPVFLARSDIFKKKLIARILYFLKILPVYRIRDGYATLKNNEEIFRKTMDVLKNKNGLVVLPEGSHVGFRKLRVLKKGIARLAFQTAETEHFIKDIKIVPVGIDYSHYAKFRQKLIVNYGDPISLKEYYDLYHKNSNRAIQAVMRELTNRMKKRMIHIPDDKHYNIYDDLRQLFQQRIAGRFNMDIHHPAQRLEAQQKFISLLDDYLQANEQNAAELEKELREYNQKLSKFNVRNWVLGEKTMSIAGFILRAFVFLFLLPLFAYGAVNNILPYKIPIDIADKLKDKSFVSSFKFVLSFILFPLFYIVQTLIVLLTVHPLWISPAYLISLPVTGIFAFQYYILFKKFRARWKYSVLNRKNNQEISRLKNLHQSLVKIIDRITSLSAKNTTHLHSKV